MKEKEVCDLLTKVLSEKIAALVDGDGAVSLELVYEIRGLSRAINSIGESIIYSEIVKKNKEGRFGGAK